MTGPFFAPHAHGGPKEQKVMPDDPQKPSCREEWPNQQSATARPTQYTKAIGHKICGRLVEDESLRSICADPVMPDLATVSDWIAKHPEFRDHYALAREFQAHCIADEIIELIDEVSPHWVERVRNGRVVLGPDRKRVARCRLRIAAREFVADALFARARQLSKRTFFELPNAPEWEILQGRSRDFSHKKKG
jgi:hypothetical protein